MRLVLVFMNLRRLELFVAVAEELHFSRAADRLHMAQPPLSQQVRKLEHECGFPLFERDSRNVRLTAEGHLLLAHARRVLAQYRTMDAAIRHARDGEAGRLRLGFVSSAAISAIPLIARRLRTSWPEIELQLREETTDAQIDLIRDGALDAGLVREVTSVPGMNETLLRHERLVVAVPSDHHLAACSSVSLRELSGAEFITFPRARISRLFDRIAALLHEADVDLVVAQEALQFPTILGLVAAHIGIAIVPQSMEAFVIPGVTYLDLDDSSAHSRVSMIYRSDMAESPLLKKLLEAAPIALS